MRISQALQILIFIKMGHPIEHWETRCSLENSIFLWKRCIQCIQSTDYTSKHSDKRFNTSLTQIFPRSFNRSRLRFKLFKSGESSETACLRDSLYISRAERADGVRHLQSRKIIRVVTIKRAPFVLLDDEKFSGVIFDYLYALQTKYNFSMDIFLPYDGNWGSLLKNGEWNGMIGMVTRNEADLGAASFSVTLERALAVDFSMAFHDEPTGILIPAPLEDEQLTVFFKPFGSQVWILLITTILVLAPTLVIMHLLTLALRGEGPVKTKISELLSRVIVFMIGSILQEGLTSPMNKTARLMTFLWWWVTVILSNIYVGFLISYLSAPILYNIVDSLEDLSQHGKLKWTFRKHTAHQALFKSESSSGVYKVIGNGVAESELVSSDQDGVKKTLSGKHAFIKELSFLDVALENDFIETNTCRLTIAKQKFFTVGFAIALQLDSPFRKLLDYEISNTIATGLMKKWKASYWPKKLQCRNAAQYLITNKPKDRSLTLDDLYGAYVLYFFGLLLALLGFIKEQLEQIWKKHFPYWRRYWGHFINYFRLMVVRRGDRVVRIGMENKFLFNRKY